MNKKKGLTFGIINYRFKNSTLKTQENVDIALGFFISLN
ncbi:protein of unknown function [Shewanella benthica]|uniref:Uncharacterized protein n=1 Tax=Shewanella benthica TaxID=43661 RepID=A0A330M268_9GAMM|nr:protein of unknown function [Shewanella benthica]